MPVKKREKKSGFEEGRSKKKGSSSSSLSNQIEKVEKAKNKLSEILDEERDSKHSKKKKSKRGEHIGLIGSDADDDEEVLSVFEKQIGKIKKRIDAADDDAFNASKTEELLLRAMLKTTIDLIPIAERAFRKSGREQAAYAFRSLNEQVVDFNTRLKMIGDVENQMKFIRENILDPMFRAQANTFLTAFVSMKEKVDTEVDNRKSAKLVKRHLDESLQMLGEFMDKTIEKISNDIGLYLSGDMSAFGAAPQKKVRRKRKE
jgi:hypothetical protein